MPGLGVRVRPSGHRGYVYQCKVDGRAKRVTLGPAALKTVAEVRRECLEIEVTKKSGEPLMHMAPVARVCHQMLRLRLGRGNG